MNNQFKFTLPCLFAALLLLFSCKQPEKAAMIIDPAFTGYISTFTPAYEGSHVLLFKDACHCERSDSVVKQMIIRFDL